MLSVFLSDFKQIWIFSMILVEILNTIFFQNQPSGNQVIPRW